MYAVKYRLMFHPRHPGHKELYDRTNSEGTNMANNCVFLKIHHGIV